MFNDLFICFDRYLNTNWETNCLKTYEAEETKVIIQLKMIGPTQFVYMPNFFVQRTCSVIQGELLM